LVYCKCSHECSSIRKYSLALSEYRNDFNIHIDELSDKDIVFIWSKDLIKDVQKNNFHSQQEESTFENTYYEYYNKRWEEMSKIEMSIEDWEILKQRWKIIKKEKPLYTMFELDDSGSLDKVNILGKNELSQEDIDYIKQEHEKYLKYEKARQKYIANHPDYSDVWRGPQDDEYEADIMKYYED